MNCINSATISILVGLGDLVGSVSVQRNLDMDDALAERHPKVHLDVVDHGIVHDVLGFGEPVVAKGERVWL